MRAKSITALLCVALLSLVCDIVVAEENEIFNDLMMNGVTLSDGTKAQLPPIVMKDGLDAAGQLAVLKGLVVKARLASFSGGNVNDWIDLKIEGKPATPATPSNARNLDLYFVANGTPEAIADKAFLKQVLGAANAFQILNEQQLKPLGIELPADTATKRERYAHAKLDLFNMVNVRATVHEISIRQKDSLLIAFTLDPQFQQVVNFPNQWALLKLGPAGIKAPGVAQPYEGAAGYAKVTRVVDSTKPQVFIEYHLVFDEPYGWFEGKPILTSKLPTKVDIDVRNFRRDLVKFMRAAAPPPIGTAASANANLGGMTASEENEKKADKIQPAAETNEH